MKAMFKKIYILGGLLILVISMIFIIQYSYMNNIIIKNKELNIEQSTRLLGQKINSELKLYSQVIESTSTMIGSNDLSEYEIVHNLKSILQDNLIFNVVYYGSSDYGLLNALNWVAPEDYDMGNRPWYTKAIGKGGLVYSETYIDARTGGLAISISKPIYDGHKRVKGVVGGDILINEIINLVKESSLGVGEIGYSFLIDSKGNILAHPDYAYDDYSKLKNIDEISHLLSLEMKEEGYGEKQMIIEGVDGYLSYQPIENTDWIIGSFASLEEYSASNKYMFILLILALLAIGAAFSLFLTMQNRYFMRPLKRLVKDIEGIQIDHNDITCRLAIGEKDPFTEPRKSINHILEKAELFFRKQQEYGEELMTSHEELEAQNLQLHHLSNYDQLTELYNRRVFEKQLQIMDQEENWPLGIIMADVNGLKLINDSFGHKIGDELLKETGRVLKSGSGDKELVFRIGGDEFVILIPRTNSLEAQSIINNIRELGKEVSLHNINLSVSFGVGIKYEESKEIGHVLKEAEDDMHSNKLVEGPSMRSKTIDTIVQALYEKNPREEAHSARVSTICQEMGVALNMSDEKIKQLETVGLLHDIGKIAIPDTILEKPGPLTDEEWKEMTKHPEIGYRILGTTNEMAQIAKYALSHHERYDGKGYPQGLKGEEIPLVSRIITIADSYDAMVSDRPYRKGLPQEIAIEEIIKNAGIQFDPNLARVFIEKILEKEWKEI